MLQYICINVSHESRRMSMNVHVRVTMCLIVQVPLYAAAMRSKGDPVFGEELHALYMLHYAWSMDGGRHLCYAQHDDTTLVYDAA